MPDAVKKFIESGVAVAVATNRSKASASHLLRANKLVVDLISAPDTAGAKKPSPKICRFVATQLGIQTTEMIYVGDSDDTDALAALNARVLYLGARWANPDLKYGLPVGDPNNLVRFVRRFMLAPQKWYWTLDELDSNKKRLEV